LKIAKKILADLRLVSHPIGI